ncbi:MAG: helix-turn-helix domain protein [Hyphomicrobiales bacterium]|nr:helix-turn-helix domain protein [Hyphomicrobiales bacterium]
MPAIKPQFIDTHSGEQLVILTRADFDSLMTAAAEAEEDAADAALFDERMADLDHGLDVRLPAEVSAMMLRGDRLLRALRKWRGLTQVKLSQETGIGQGYLSDLEAGRRVGSPETMARIAGALDIDVSWIAADSKPKG